MRKLRKLLTLDSRRRLLLAKGYLSLVQAWFELSRSSSLHRLLGDVEPKPSASQAPAVSEEHARQAREVSWAVRAAAANAPWHSTCLVQALAAQRMLRARNIAGALFVGADVSRDSNDTRRFAAHAWVKCGPEFVTGEAGHEQYKVLYACIWPR